MCSVDLSLFCVDWLKVGCHFFWDFSDAHRSPLAAAAPPTLVAAALAFASTHTLKTRAKHATRNKGAWPRALEEEKGDTQQADAGARVRERGRARRGSLAAARGKQPPAGVGRRLETRASTQAPARRLGNSFGQGGLHTYPRAGGTEGHAQRGNWAERSGIRRPGRFGLSERQVGGGERASSSRGAA